MGFKYKITYATGEKEVSDEVFETYEEAEAQAQDDIYAYMCGAEELELAGRSYCSKEPKYKIIEV